MVKKSQYFFTILTTFSYYYYLIQSNWQCEYRYQPISRLSIATMILFELEEEPKYFTVKPTIGLCKIISKQFNNTQLEPVKITYTPINSNISTTGHKLQGSILDKVVVNLCFFKVQHWSYVVLSIVKKLSSLILNEILGENRIYNTNSELVRW